MPQQAIAEALAVWREAERLLEQLPPDHPDRKVIQFELVQARAIYRRLTERRDATRDVIDDSQRILERAWIALNSARERLAGGFRVVGPARSGRGNSGGGQCWTSSPGQVSDSK